METKEVHTLTPSIGGSFSFAWDKMFKQFLPLIIVIIIAGIITGPVQGTFKADEFHLWLVPVIMFGLAYTFLLVPVIDYGEQFMFLKAMREEKLEIRDLFSGFSRQYVDIILANLIVFALAILGFLMLVIPMFIVLCRLAFVPYIIMDQKLEPMAAIERSWEMTRGHGWKVFFMGIISIFIFILGLIFCFVGVFISLMWIHSAFAVLYQSVLNEDIIHNTIPILEVHES